MDRSFETLLVWLFLVVVAVLVTALYFQIKIWRMQRQHADDIEAASKRSVNQSRSTLKGQIAEQMAPMLPGFEYAPADARFLGDPVDYVVFAGRSVFAGDRESSEDLEVVLLEIKQGQSNLSSVQRAIAQAVEDGRVRFEICRVAEDGTVSTSAWRARRRPGSQRAH
jgi:predicted Holliday junction resolvase-like endonuclease